MADKQHPGLLRTLCLLVLSATPVLGQQVATETGSGRFIETTIQAPSLAGNLLGDPTEQPISLYLPPSYDVSPSKRYPVVYLLHGFTGTNRTWMVNTKPEVGEPLLGSTDREYSHRGYLDGWRLDEMIVAGKIREMIVVAPNSRNAYKHSYYVNSVATGNWEDYIVRDVVDYIDGNYRTLPQASSRGLAGYSGGGYGSKYIGMKHPDVFSSVFALAPCCLGPQFSMPPVTDSSTGELTAFWQKEFSRLL
ncbi:MAG: esterase family protein [Gammaproteobacteria bacterium]|nr:esterase family protein [Gammaproteobacteria bacterium]